MPDIQNDSAKQTRFVTLRSVVFSLLGLFLIAGLSGFHDWVLRGTSMVGNQMPASAFFYFMFLGIAWNGGWSLADRAFKCGGRLRDRFALSMRELIVVMVVTLVAMTSLRPNSTTFRSGLIYAFIFVIYFWLQYFSALQVIDRISPADVDELVEKNLLRS